MTQPDWKIRSFNQQHGTMKNQVIFRSANIIIVIDQSKQ